MASEVPVPKRNLGSHSSSSLQVFVFQIGGDQKLLPLFFQVLAGYLKPSNTT